MMPNNDSPHIDPTLANALQDFRREHAPRSLPVGNHGWTYYAAGEESAPVLLLFAGGGGDAEALFRYIQGFAAHFRVLAPNLPPTVRTLEQALAGYQHILAAETAQAAHIVGVSFGALLAQLFIRQHQERVQDVILSHAVLPSPHLGERATMQRALIAFYPAPLLRWLLRRAYKRQIEHSIVPAEAEERAFWVQYFHDLYRTRYRKAHILARSRLTCEYHREFTFSARDLQGWQGNMLLIESEEDEVIGEGDRGALQGMYPQAYLQTLHGADHLAPLLASDALTSSMVRFLRTEAR